VLPSWIINPLWDQFHALLPERIDSHPLGCHRPRVPDQVVFDKLLQVLVFGCGYERVADQTCSARTLRRRRDEWITAGIHDRLHQLALTSYDGILGLELEHLAVDGCTIKAPCGGEIAARSPVDRGKQGGKRSLAVEGCGIPLGVIPAPANRRDDGCWPPRWTPWMPLAPARTADAAPGRRLRLPPLPCRAGPAGNDRPDRLTRGARPNPGRSPGVVERSHAWLNGFGSSAGAPSGDASAWRSGSRWPAWL
jgi:transposase